jgi:hypothetical protein
MGLDMYLSRSTYIGGYFEHREVSGKVEVKIKDKILKFNPKSISEIIEQVMYWRKANQIHAWFVKNVQNGVDECQRSYVSFEKLKELYDVVCKALDTKDASILPPQSGFFFGSTDVDDYYWQDLEDTKQILEKIIKEDSETPEGYSYYYQSSW